MARKKYKSESIKQDKKVKIKEDMTADVYRDSYTIAELQRMRRALAKRANQRILRLERGRSSVTGEKWNTFGAVIDAYDYLNKKYNKTRFSENVKALTDVNALRREITVLQGFLGRKSSTVAGMIDIERKRMTTFEKGHWGVKWRRDKIPNKPIKFASTKEFYDFMNSQTFKGLVSSGFTSEQLIDLYDSARTASSEQSDDKVVEEMTKALDEYRNEGGASLKDLKERLKAVTLTD